MGEYPDRFPSQLVGKCLKCFPLVNNLSLVRMTMVFGNGFKASEVLKLLSTFAERSKRCFFQVIANVYPVLLQTFMLQSSKMISLLLL